VSKSAKVLYCLYLRVTAKEGVNKSDLEPTIIHHTCDNTVTIKKNTQTLIDTSEEVGLEVNTEKTNYMLLSRHQNAGQNHYIKIGNKCHENVAQFSYLGMTITNQNLIQE
jgi:hypothetical protein